MTGAVSTTRIRAGRSSRALSSLAWGVTLLLAAVIVLPVVWIVLGAFVPADRLGLASPPVGDVPRPSTLEPFVYLLRIYGEWIAFSGGVAVAVIVVGAAVAVPAAYVFVRHPFPGSRLLEELVLLPLGLPGIALSVALLAAYPSMRGSLLVLGGHLLYTLPFLVRTLTHALRVTDLMILEHAAQTLGASRLQRFRWIVLPEMRHALVLASLLVFTVSWGEFNVSYLLNSGHPQTFPAALYNTYANESLERSSAATLIFLAGVLPALAILQWRSRARAPRVEQGA